MRTSEVLKTNANIALTNTTTLLTYTSREVNEARWSHTCSRPCAFGKNEKKNEKKKTRKNLPHSTHHEIHSTPATATTSRRRAMKHVPRVRPHSPIDPRRVEIGLVQIPQSISRRMLHIRREIHRETDRQTDKLNNDPLYAPRYY